MLNTIEAMLLSSGITRAQLQEAYGASEPVTRDDRRALIVKAGGELG